MYCQAKPYRIMYRNVIPLLFVLKPVVSLLSSENVSHKIMCVDYL